jgi:hypothetical membrane protein
MRATRIGLHLGWLAGPCFALAACVAVAMPGYVHAQHALGWLGSALNPQAAAFNTVGFGASGLMLAGFALALERWFAPATRVLRIATGMLAIAGVAFAAQGAFQLDPNDIDGRGSSAHAALHSVAQLAWFAALGLLAMSLRRVPHRVLGMTAALAALALLAITLLPRDAWPGPGVAERAQWGVFFAWPAFAAWTTLRRGATQSV